MRTQIAFFKQHGGGISASPNPGAAAQLDSDGTIGLTQDGGSTRLNSSAIESVASAGAGVLDWVEVTTGSLQQTPSSPPDPAQSFSSPRGPAVRPLHRLCSKTGCAIFFVDPAVGDGGHTGHDGDPKGHLESQINAAHLPAGRGGCWGVAGSSLRQNTDLDLSQTSQAFSFTGTRASESGPLQSVRGASLSSCTSPVGLLTPLTAATAAATAAAAGMCVHVSQEVGEPGGGGGRLSCGQLNAFPMSPPHKRGRSNAAGADRWQPLPHLEGLLPPPLPETPRVTLEFTSSELSRHEGLSMSDKMTSR